MTYWCWIYFQPVSNRDIQSYQHQSYIVKILTSYSNLSVSCFIFSVDHGWPVILMPPNYFTSTFVIFCHEAEPKQNPEGLLDLNQNVALLFKVNVFRFLGHRLLTYIIACHIKGWCWLNCEYLVFDLFQNLVCLVWKVALERFLMQCRNECL